MPTQVIGGKHAVLVLLLVGASIVLEALWRRYRLRRGYDVSAALASAGVALGHAIVGLGNAVVIGGLLTLAWQWTPLRWSLDSVWTWITGFFAVEFAYYWFHRASHTVRWMWATHAVHHSATELTLPAAVRLGWTSVLSGGWLFYLPLVLAGWHPLLVTGLLAFNLKFQFLLHTEVVGKLGVLEWIFNTPAHHRVHHASNPEYLDRNYGGVLIVFDRWFSTFAAERSEAPLRYGLVHGVDTRNPFKLAFHEWARLFHDARHAMSVRALWRTLFGAPV